VGARSEFGLVGTTGEAIRAAMEIVGLKVGDVRPPFVSFSEAEKQKLAAILDQMGVPKYDG
jgi:dihydrodipicolinate synthase/N-acetylneuraminate lyase